MAYLDIDTLIEDKPEISDESIEIQNLYLSTAAIFNTSKTKLVMFIVSKRFRWVLMISMEIVVFENKLVNKFVSQFMRIKRNIVLD